MPDLHVIPAEPVGTDIIERLEEALSKARAGEVSSVAIALVYRDGCIEGSWSAPPSHGLLLGSVNRLAYRINQVLD